MLVLRVIALVLDSIVDELVRHELQALTSPDKHHKNAYLDKEVADVVAQSLDDNHLVAVFERVVEDEVSYLEAQQKTINRGDEVGAASLKLKGSTLADCAAQHHNGVQIQGDAGQGEQDV